MNNLKAYFFRMFRLSFFTLVVLALLNTVDVFAKETGDARPLKCVYFVPSDCQPYPDRAARLYRVMKYVQDFYRSEMERNGFGPMTFGLEEDNPGELKLYEVQAPKEQAAYGRDSHGAVREIVVKELAKLGIDASKEVVVIFQIGLRWEGNKAIEVSSFVGGGTSFNGTAWFYDDPMLDPEKLSSKEPGGYYGRPCSVGEFNSHYIGGIAHELGHALTLPHDCELATETPLLGNALMGAGNHTFGREKRGEGKGAFLTYSEALRLSVVPAVSGQKPQRRADDVRLIDLRAERVSKSAVRFTGFIETGSPVLGLIFYEDRDSRRSDYDAKTWTVKPDENGSFEIELTEVAPEPSELRIVAVRDVDSVTLAKFSYNPNGSDGEFDPITRFFNLKRISTAYASKNAGELNALAAGEFTDSPEWKKLCEELAQTVSKPESPVVPSKVDADSFDLSNAEFSVQKVGWARLVRNASLENEVLSAGGKAFSRGLFAHAPSLLKCDLGQKWKRFAFEYGLQEGKRGSVVFVVRGDGRELFRSDVVADAALRSAELDVSGVTTLELITEDAGNGNTTDHSVWFQPTLFRE